MEQLPKVAISTDAERSLEELRELVNKETPSRITKGQLASWIICNFRNSLMPKSIEKIRADHFDEIAHLESVVRQLKEARKAKAPLEVQELLTPVLQRQRANPPGPLARLRDKEPKKSKEASESAE